MEFISDTQPDIKYSLNDLMDMITRQAENKGWDNSDNWLFRKIQNEIAELDEAVQIMPPSRRSEEEIAMEGIDVLYLLVQILKNHCPNINLQRVFEVKFDKNNSDKKKTWSKEKRKIVRK